jgi:hypothetical protein
MKAPHFELSAAAAALLSMDYPSSSTVTSEIRQGARSDDLTSAM